jgi:glutathione peroxidase
MADDPTAWDFTFVGIDGTLLPLAQFRGKALLVVNTASKCGFTPQYKPLQDLAEKYGERGLVVLGVPSNDFGGQEPGTAPEIAQFCDLTYKVTFPLTEKVKVTGDDAHPFYRWAGQKVGLLGRPKWNFHKYLVAPDGQLADWFSSVTSPDADKVVQAVENLLTK